MKSLSAVAAVGENRALSVLIRLLSAVSVSCMVVLGTLSYVLHAVGQVLDTSFTFYLMFGASSYVPTCYLFVTCMFLA